MLQTLQEQNDLLQEENAHLRRLMAQSYETNRTTIQRVVWQTMQRDLRALQEQNERQQLVVELQLEENAQLRRQMAQLSLNMDETNRTTIQRVARGFLARQFCHRARRISATCLQRMLRGHLSRVQVTKPLQIAVLCMQKAARRKIVYRKLVKWNAAAVLAQAAARRKMVFLQLVEWNRCSLKIVSLVRLAAVRRMPIVRLWQGQKERFVALERATTRAQIRCHNLKRRYEQDQTRAAAATAKAEEELAECEKKLASFECPITHEVPVDPVICLADGHTYERRAIERALRVNPCSPLTRVRADGARDLVSFAQLPAVINELRASSGHWRSLVTTGNSVVWSIDDFATKRLACVTSPELTFATSNARHDYTIRVMIFPNGNREEREEHRGAVGIYLVLRRGSNHDALEWPFNKRLAFRILTTDKQKEFNPNTSVGFRDYCNENSPPRADNFAGYGWPTFLSQDDANAGLGVHNDRLTVMITLG